MNHKIVFFSIIFLFIIPSSECFVRKFNQQNFDQWVDEKNFLIVLFCQSENDKSCMKENEKLKKLADELSNMKDLIFGYVDKDTDRVLFSRYFVNKYPIIKLIPYGGQAQEYEYSIRIADLKNHILNLRESFQSQPKSSVDSKPVKSKKFKMPEYEWQEVVRIIKDREKSSLLVLYDDVCEEPCLLLDRIAEIFKNDEEILIHKISKENLGLLSNELGLETNPTLYWYPKEEPTNSYRYGGSLTLEVIVEFINDRTGLSRDVNGNLKSNAGRIMELDGIVQENIISILLRRDMDRIISTVEEKAKHLPHAKQYTDYYLAILKEIRNGGEPEQILQREQEFISRRLSKKSLSNLEKEKWRKYYNIITVFVEFAAKELMNTTKQKAELKKDPYIDAMLKSSHHDEL